jgi:DNA-binding MarR family transcriptional regulator
MSDIKVNVFVITRSFKALQQGAYEPIRKKTGLNQMELQIIYSMAQSPVDATIGDIYKQTQFNKGQISVCVARLFKKDYVIQSGMRGRFETYCLSEKGKDTADQIEKNASYGRKKLLEGFTKEEIKNFENYLQRLMSNASKAHGKPKFEE